MSTQHRNGHWVVLGLLLCSAAGSAELPGQKEALALAFPNAALQRKEYFLTEAQAEKVKALAGAALKGRFVVAYEARAGGAPVGVAFFDTHVVRTLPETAMVAISPKGRVLRIEVVNFHEPEEYRASAAWLGQFTGKALSPGLTLKGEIRPLAGASLTARSLTDAARRSLALFQVLYGGGAP